MTAPARRPRRRSGHGAESPTLARLAAAREQLDAEIVERRRREDEQLTEYAAATDAVTEAEARRDAALADLERQATQVREAAEQELATLEARRGAVLVALHADRTAEELATLVSLPLRRVRTLLRTHREPPAAAVDSPTPPHAQALGPPRDNHLPGPRPTPRRRRTRRRSRRRRAGRFRPRRCQMPTPSASDRRIVGAPRSRTALHPPPEQRGQTVSQVATRRSPHRAAPAVGSGVWTPSSPACRPRTAWRRAPAVPLR